MDLGGQIANSLMPSVAAACGLTCVVSVKMREYSFKCWIIQLMELKNTKNILPMLEIFYSLDEIE